MKVKYTVKGLDKFVSRVKQLPEKTQRSVDKELGLSSLRVERQAKIYAPWDTGWLSNHIYANKVGNLQYEVVSPVHYSIYLELGTRYMMAQPFMYPALEEEYWPLMRRLSQIVGGQ